MLSPTTRPSRPSASNGLTSSHASGAPSEPCLGASLRFLMLDRTTPMGRSCAGLPRCLCLLIFLPAFFLDLIENFSNPERSFRVLGLSSAIIPYAVKRSHTLFLVPSLFRSMTANPRVIHRNLRSSRLDVFDKQLLAVNEVVDEMLCQQKPE